MSDITESQIRARLVVVENQIAKHRLAISQLERELGGLQGAIEVIDTLRKQLADDDTLALFETPAVEALQAKVRPTVPEMIFEALGHASDLGLPGLEPKAILAFIKQKYWPDAGQQSVGPIAWRMAVKEHRIKKVGSRYYLLTDETPVGTTAGVSEPGEGADDDDSDL